jgi:hypothetical protein
MPTVQPRYTRRDKYTLVGDMLKGRSGSLLDVGARDRILLHYIDPARIRYFSCDFGPGHDYAFDLEKPVPLPDRSFDFVAALDVLEHVEAAHAAFHELMRLVRRMIFISLPNLNSLKYRLQYLFSGRLSGKYLLLPEHQGDRHRWLPVYADIYPFVTLNAERAGFAVTDAYNLIEFGGPLRLLSVISRGAAALNVVADGLFTNTIIFGLQRREGV